MLESQYSNQGVNNCDVLRTICKDKHTIKTMDGKAAQHRSIYEQIRTSRTVKLMFNGTKYTCKEKRIDYT